MCLERGGNLSLIFSPKHKDPGGFDVHQIRGTYYSLLDCDDDAYLAARAIQFFTPGVPQVYYVGLLAGENDQASAEKSGEGRDINRHNFSLEEIDRFLEKNVVQRLLKLIRFRNEYPAFNGEFKVLESSQGKINLAWQKDDKNCTLQVDLKTYCTTIEHIDEQGKTIEYFV
jgi:sucrose phosphorylase